MARVRAGDSAALATCKNDKSREIVKTIEIDNKREFIRLGEIVQ